MAKVMDDLGKMKISPDMIEKVKENPESALSEAKDFMAKGEALFGKEGVKEFMNKMKIPADIKAKILSKNIAASDFT